jgi:hypothetical protein
MPSPLIKAYSKKSGKSKSKIERYWREAKDAAKKKFKKKSDSFWAYANAITKRRAGLASEGQAAPTFKQFFSEDVSWAPHKAKNTEIQIEHTPEFNKERAAEKYALRHDDKTVIIDNVNGIGSVPLNRSVMYHGFVVFMKPSDFLRVAGPDHGVQDGRATEIIDLLKQGYSIGNPFLDMDIREDDENGVLRLKLPSHEGRGRMKAIRQYLGDVPVPVHILLRGGWRNRDIKHEVLAALKGPIHTERGEVVHGTNIFKKIIT